MASIAQDVLDKAAAAKKARAKKQTPNTLAAKAVDPKPAKAEKAPKEEKAPKAPRKPALPPATGDTPDPSEFFGENRKGKPVFRAGWDARLTQALKRVQAGVGTPHDLLLSRSPVILNHPKVVKSKHFQVLLGNEEEEEE